MYGAIDNEISPPPSPTVVVTPTEFKVYRRRWLYLICICLANMSNAIVRFSSTAFFVKENWFFFSYGSILLQLRI
jgi:hypothetical protein